MKKAVSFLGLVALIAGVLGGPAARATTTTTKIADGSVQALGVDDAESVSYIQGGCPSKQLSGTTAAFMNITAYRGKTLIVKIGSADTTAPPPLNPVPTLIVNGHETCSLPDGINAPNFSWTAETAPPRDATFTVPSTLVFLGFAMGTYRNFHPYLGLHFTVWLVQVS